MFLAAARRAGTSDDAGCRRANTGCARSAARAHDRYGPLTGSPVREHRGPPLADRERKAAGAWSDGMPMAVYVYRCDAHGFTERSLPIGTAQPTTSCPTCGATAMRVFTAPRLSLGDATRRALIDRTERSRDEPAVVSSPGPRPSRRAPAAANPALRRLPRP